MTLLPPTIHHGLTPAHEAEMNLAGLRWGTFLHDDRPKIHVWTPGDVAWVMYEPSNPWSKPRWSYWDRVKGTWVTARSARAAAQGGMASWLSTLEGR